MLQDPYLRTWAAGGVTGFEWDERFTDCDSGTYGEESERVRVEAIRLDGAGDPFGAWVNIVDFAIGTHSCMNNNAHYNAEPGTAQPDGAAAWRVRWIGIDTATIFGVAETYDRSGLDAPTNLRLVTTSPPGQQLTYDQVAALGWKNGWTGEQVLTEMVAVTRQESAFRTKAISYIGCCFGLMQVYASVHGTTQEAMFDPYQNVTKGREIYVAAGHSWQPWEAYTGPDASGSDGPWLQWESRAREAAKRQRACGGCAYDSIASAPQTGSGSAVIAWDTTCVDCTYVVQRDGATIGTTNELTLVDNAAAPGVTYVYRVKATKATKADSPFSSTLSVTAGEANPDAGGVVDGDPEDVAGNDEDGSNSGDGRSCWSINPITVIKCALRWAFMPGEATESAWASFYDNLKTRPPFSVAFGTGAYIIEMAGDIEEAFDLGTTNGYDCVTFTVQELGENEACFAGPLGQIATEQATLVGAIRTGFNIFIIAGTIWMVWRILKTAFSSSPEVEDKEQLTSGGDEKKDDD